MKNTVIAVYNDFATARAAVEDLVAQGFTRDDISLVVNDVENKYSEYVDYDETEDVKGDEGAGFGAVVGTLVGLGVALIPGIGPVVAAGPLAAALMAGIGAAAGAVTGGITASLIDMGVPESEAHVYAESVRRGGVMVSAHVEDMHTERVRQILNARNPLDLNARATNWRTEGWSKHTPNDRPMTYDEIQRERERYM